MELVHPGEVAREQVKVQEWAGLVGEEWVVRELVQDREENARVQNAERLFLMRSEHLVTL
jgi:ribonuclease D